MAKRNHPSFINPATGRRYDNYLTLIPGIGLPITHVTVDQFIDALHNRRADHNAWAHYFDQIGWPEGYVYCTQSEPYTRLTGFNCMLKTAKREHLGMTPA
jgi:hypothetical protein